MQNSEIQSIGSLIGQMFPQPKREATVTQPQTPPVAQPLRPQTYFHPIITPQDYKESIKNYGLWVKKYNMEVWIESAQVRDHNREVSSFRKAAIISLEAKVREGIWKKERKALTPEKYNAEVDQYNVKHNGLWLNKKPLRQEVKKTSEAVFLAILHQLNTQLYDRKRMRHSLGVHIETEVPKVRIYPNKIVSLERNGYLSLPISKETFCAHRNRLEEAGVLQGYEFHGVNRPVKIQINPEILKVSDNEKPKKARNSRENPNAENQSLNSPSTKKPPHVHVSTRTKKDKDQVREKEGNFSEKEKLVLNCTGTSTGTPKGKITVPKNSPGPKISLSEKLRATIQDQTDLSQELSEGKHNDHRPIPNKYTESEALNGFLDQEEYKELAIQDIFKFSALLFVKLDVFAGSWQNAFKIWMEEMWKSPNGHTLSKPIIHSRWQNCISVLKKVYAFQKRNPDWQIRYPSLYFDPARTSKFESSFAYALRNFATEPAPAKTKTARKLEHLKNSRSVNDLKKAQRKAREFFAKKISLDDLYEYVEQNCNAQIYEQINEIVKTEWNKTHKHAAK